MTNDSTVKYSYLTNVLITVLIGMAGIFYTGINKRLAAIEDRLLKVELNNVQIMTHLGIESCAKSFTDPSLLAENYLANTNTPFIK